VETGLNCDSVFGEFICDLYTSLEIWLSSMESKLPRFYVHFNFCNPDDDVILQLIWTVSEISVMLVLPIIELALLRC